MIIRKMKDETWIIDGIEDILLQCILEALWSDNKTAWIAEMIMDDIATTTALEEEI